MAVAEQRGVLGNGGWTTKSLIMAASVWGLEEVFRRGDIEGGSYKR